MNGRCNTEQINTQLTVLGIIYDSLGVSRIQWVTETGYYSSSRYPSTSPDSQFIEYKFTPSNPWIGVKGTSGGEHIGLTSMGLITFNSLCPLFNVTEEKQIVERIRNITAVSNTTTEKQVPEIQPLPWVVGGVAVLVFFSVLIVSAVFIRKH
jgi:hypothetical protein